MNAREAALRILQKVEEDGSYLNQMQKEVLIKLKDRDRQFASALVFCVLENRIRIDFVIDQFVAKKPDKIARQILRIGTAQLLFMHVPESAAVNESVSLADKCGKKGQKGFLNAVLRKIGQEKEQIKYPGKKNFVKHYSVMESCPEWLVSMLAVQYSKVVAADILTYKKQENGINVRINALLGKTEINDSEPSMYHENARRIRGENIENDPLYLAGKITPQSESSMFCVEAAGIKEGMTVLDLCAAPGGKSAYAAEFKPERIVSCDIHPHRCELMKKNFDRLGVSAEVLVNDATVLREDFIGEFDVVLVDAPCSSLGLMYRKPDIKYAKTEEDLKEIIAMQKKILKMAAEYVKPGGILLYSTCTINKEENENNIEAFLAEDTRFSGEAFPDERLKNWTGENEYSLQLIPPVHHTDGFYMARLRKK